VYVPASFTVIDEVISLVLHNKEPVYPEADKTALPQLLITDIAGAAGVGFGTAKPLPGPLVQPLMVWVTVYIPPIVTLMDGLVAPLLHNKEPVNPEAVKTELLQLSITMTEGATTEEFKGAAIPLPDELVHPFVV
jgi:hypothetical protein